jgi:hypothetical protein
MAEIDWDGKADWLTIEEACKWFFPDDPHSRAKFDDLVRRAIAGGTLHPIRILRRGRYINRSDNYILGLQRADLLAWAQGKLIPIPADGDVARPANSPLHGSERDSLLKMVLGMAMSTYDYKPGTERNRATGENKGSISDDLHQRGLTLDADTVRKFIKEAETRFKHVLRNPQKP